MNLKVVSAKAFEDGEAGLLNVEGTTELDLSETVNLADLCKVKSRPLIFIPHIISGMDTTNLLFSTNTFKCI